MNKNKLDEAEAEVVNAHSMSPVRVCSWFVHSAANQGNFTS